ncbi:hypothetical protein Btru_007592 [Bulinus truncatus]|nr:hypothetical protein Btru_007592 [Bulinus truncatus]
MSSNDKTPDGQELRTHLQSTQDMPNEGSYSSPRPPKCTTESRVLNIVRERQNNENNRDQLSQKLYDCSVPPPQGNHVTQSYQTSHQPLTLPEIKSTLSATAKEFVPRNQVEAGYDVNSYEGSQYPQDSSYSLSVAAAVFVPRGPEDYSYDQYYPPQYEYAGNVGNYLVPDMNSLSLLDYSPYGMQRESTGNPIVDRFNNSLDILNMNPGNMEEYLRPICEMIQQSSASTETVNGMVESLFRQSIQEQNFRYTGARICQYLASALKSNSLFNGFHKIFMKRCQSEYAKRNELLSGNPADQERLRGLAMFMAEIFLNVETELEDGTKERIKFLPKILIDFVHTLLTQANDANVKCSCQLLKLSGGLMEDIVKSTPNDCMAFENIFDKLESLKSSSLSENAKFLVNSVIDLKNKDWNRSVSSPPKKPMYFQADPNNFQVQEPVFYNNGNVCSREDAGLPEEDAEDGAYVLNEEEEAAFLEWQAEQDIQSTEQESFFLSDTGYDSYNPLDEIVDDGGMGDEVEAAYEEFLQSTVQSNYIQGYQSNQSLPPTQPSLPSLHMYPQQPGMSNYFIPPNAHIPMPPHMMHPQQNQEQPQQQQQQQQYPYKNGDHFHYQKPN